MATSAIVAGTGQEGRAQIIARYVRDGMRIDLVREPKNKFDPNAIAVYLCVPAFFGIFTSRKKIGYIKKERAVKLAAKMDNGFKPRAHVVSFECVYQSLMPRVSIEFE